MRRSPAPSTFSAFFARPRAGLSRTAIAVALAGVFASASIGFGAAHADGGIQQATGAVPVVSLLSTQSGVTLLTVHEGARFTLAGEGFAAGSVLINLDGHFGLPLGTAASGSDGRISIPLTMLTGVAGQHTLVAREMTAGRTLEAGVEVFVQPAR